MKLRRTRNGRIKDMDTGLFVNKKLAKSFANGKKIPLLKTKKSTKRSKTSDEHHAMAKCVLRVYGTRSNHRKQYAIDFSKRGFDDEDLVYFAHYLNDLADEDIKKEITDNEK